jgi:hypothetical protein
VRTTRSILYILIKFLWAELTSWVVRGEAYLRSIWNSLQLPASAQQDQRISSSKTEVVVIARLFSMCCLSIDSFKSNYIISIPHSSVNLPLKKVHAESLLTQPLLLLHSYRFILLFDRSWRHNSFGTSELKGIWAWCSIREKHFKHLLHIYTRFKVHRLEKNEFEFASSVIPSQSSFGTKYVMVFIPNT